MQDDEGSPQTPYNPYNVSCVQRELTEHSNAPQNRIPSSELEFSDSPADWTRKRAKKISHLKEKAFVLPQITLLEGELRAAKGCEGDL